MTRVSAVRSADTLKARGCCDDEKGVHNFRNATALCDAIRSVLYVGKECIVDVVLMARGVRAMGPRSWGAVRDNIVGY